jgi:hypothetical protein
MRVVALIWCLLVMVCTAQAGRGVVAVALLNVEARGEALKEVGPKISSLLATFLSAETNLVLIERAELEKALGEQKLSLSETVSAENGEAIGNVTGAKVLISGKAFKVGDELVVAAKLVGTETGRVYSEVARGSADTVDKLSEELAKKISRTVVAREDSLFAKVFSREERVQSILKNLNAVRRPVIAIHLPERRSGTPVVDPAAETELGLILQECGFTLVDAKSAKPADIEIAGEAFSTSGVRRGQLASCKARIELKAYRKADGCVVAVDRETSIAADIAEQAAARTALEDAAAKLAARLAPKLVVN